MGIQVSNPTALFFVSVGYKCHINVGHQSPTDVKRAEQVAVLVFSDITMLTGQWRHPSFPFPTSGTLVAHRQWHSSQQLYTLYAQLLRVFQFVILKTPTKWIVH